MQMKAQTLNARMLDAQTVISQMVFLLQTPSTLVNKTDSESRRIERVINFMLCSVFEQLCDSEWWNLPVPHFIQLDMECFSCSSPRLSNLVWKASKKYKIFFRILTNDNCPGLGGLLI